MNFIEIFDDMKRYTLYCGFSIKSHIVDNLNPLSNLTTLPIYLAELTPYRVPKSGVR